MKVRIIIDSTADVSADIKNRFTVVPLTVHFGEEEYIDGVTITHKQFYEKLNNSDVLPSTSQATPDVFEKIFKEVADAGESAVVITISAKLSGTCQSAVIAAENYDNIYVVDSHNVTIGAGVLAELALKLADEGVSAADIAAELEKERDNVIVIALLDTLEYLKRGGRISKTVAFAGGILSIKPVISVYDGEIETLGKARGTKQGNSMLISEIEKTGGIDYTKPLLLGYTGLSDDLLLKYIQDTREFWECGTDNLNYAAIGSVVGTHAGPGAFAAAFFKK